MSNDLCINIKGLTNKIEYKDDHLTQKMTMDFSKADISELKSKQLIQTDGDQKANYISYKETVKSLEASGYKESLFSTEDVLVLEK